MGSDLAIQHHFGRLASTRPRHRAVSPLANFFKTRDERWLCLVPRQGGKDFALLCRAIDRHDIAEDARFTSARGRREHVAELVTAVALVAAPQVGGVAALAVLAVFTVVVAYAVRRGVTAGCTCFGVVSAKPVSWRDVGRNVVLAGLAAAAWLTSTA